MLFEDDRLLKNSRGSLREAAKGFKVQASQEHEAREACDDPKISHGQQVLSRHMVVITWQSRRMWILIA